MNFSLYKGSKSYIEIEFNKYFFYLLPCSFYFDRIKFYQSDKFRGCFKIDLEWLCFRFKLLIVFII